jgi:hypothetical protein
LTADRWFVGREVREDKAPFGQPLLLEIDPLDVSVSYAVTDRWTMTGTLPFSRGTHSRFYADGRRHRVSAAGLGDMSIVGSAWVFDPRSHPSGNVSLGMGVKSPSGRNDVRDTYFLAQGTTDFTVDQSIQLGDGGWGIVLQGLAFARVSERVSGYASGSYLVTPQNQSSVLQSPSGSFASVYVSIPDVFSASAGLSFGVSRRHGLAASFSGRVDGIPTRDLTGRSDGFRRPVVLGYLEPSLTLTRGRSTVTLNAPVRVYEDFRPSLIDRQLGSAGGGDLARYLLFAGYQVRF